MNKTLMEEIGEQFKQVHERIDSMAQLIHILYKYQRNIPNDMIDEVNEVINDFNLKCKVEEVLSKYEGKK
jgi:two-component sensor histidine kinase